MIEIERNVIIDCTAVDMTPPAEGGFHMMSMGAYDADSFVARRFEPGTGQGGALAEHRMFVHGTEEIDGVLFVTVTQVDPKDPSRILYKQMTRAELCRA